MANKKKVLKMKVPKAKAPAKKSVTLTNEICTKILLLQGHIMGTQASIQALQQVGAATRKELTSIFEGAGIPVDKEVTINAAKGLISWEEV